MVKKNIVQDVVPNKKSIRNVELPSKTRMDDMARKEFLKESPKMRAKMAKEDEFARSVNIQQDAPIKMERKSESPKGEINPPNNQYKYEYDKPRKSSRKLYYSLLVIFIGILYFGISSVFKSAEIQITPETQVKNINDTFTARKDASPTNLAFQTVSLVKEAEDSVEAGKEERVEKKATGKIVIYNTTTQTQKLVATTRFQTPEGLIFRIVSPISIPPKQGSVSGSIEATVEADKTGDLYNISLKDFTVPGFKGDPKYTQVYARSKTEMIGGFSGMQKVVDDATLKSKSAELEEKLKATLSKDIASQIPENFVLYQNSLTYSFDPVVIANNPNGGALLKKKGIASAIIFDRASLSKALLSKILPEAENDVIHVTNLDTLTFTYTAPGSFDPNTSNSVAFSLAGSANLVWGFDENKLKSDLLGLSKKNALNIISKYTTIKEAWIITRPFWSNTIPLKSEKVTLINTLK